MRRDQEDAEILEVRAAREAISRECGNDPWKLVAFFESFRLEDESQTLNTPSPEAVCAGKTAA